jgi:hypothetical protein
MVDWITVAIISIGAMGLLVLAIYLLVKRHR